MYYSTCLAHHGILGQKWGKRNGPPYPLDAEDHSKAEQKAGWRKSLDKPTQKTKVAGQKSESGKVESPKKGLTDKQKKIIKGVLIATAAVGVTTAMVYASKKANFDQEYFNNSMLKRNVAEIGLNNLDDKDLVFEKGFEFHRMSTREFEDYGSSDKVYAAFKPEDINRYKAKLPDFFKQWKENGVDLEPNKLYDIALKANTEIRSPSAKKRVEAFVDLFEDSSFRAKLSKSFGVSPDMFDAMVKYRMGGNKKAALSLYEQFALALNGKGEFAEAPKMYFDKIRSMGYNAIVDDNDAGKLSETPMILLDPKNNFVVEGGRQVKKLEKFMAVMKLTGADMRKAGTR